MVILLTSAKLLCTFCTPHTRKVIVFSATCGLSGNRTTIKETFQTAYPSYCTVRYIQSRPSVWAHSYLMYAFVFCYGRFMSVKVRVANNKGEQKFGRRGSINGDINPHLEKSDNLYCTYPYLISDNSLLPSHFERGVRMSPRVVGVRSGKV